jgi:aminoglycoside phosphotransferase (APT) family kinase protein
VERIGAGREAEVFAWDQGRVLRLAHHPEAAPLIAREAAALRAAAEAGAPVPELFEEREHHGRPGLVMERCEGRDQLVRLVRRPWSVRAVGRHLARVHAELHEVEAPPSLPALRDELQRILESPLVPEDLRGRARSELAARPDGDRLCHGDFHPGNVLGDRVIDWGAAVRGNPAADVARTCLLIGIAEPPGPRPAWLRLIERAGRWHLLHAYLRAYRKRRPLDQDEVERWLAVLTTARLAEGIEEERDATLQAARNADAVRVPGHVALVADQRRWVWQNAVALTAVLNALINAGIAWASAGDHDTIPLWATSGPSTITDTVGTLFLLPLITCLLVTTAVRRDTRAGTLTPRRELVHALPSNRLARGAVLGAATVCIAAPPAVAALAALDFGDISATTFVVYKAALGVALGALVTPFIAIAAMSDA